MERPNFSLKSRRNLSIYVRVSDAQSLKLQGKKNDIIGAKNNNK
jgi:hypothetical protein